MSDEEEELLSDYFDGRMPRAERAAFERRLSEEPALARRLRLLRALRSSLKAAAPAMPADLKAELKRRARLRAPRPSFWEAWRERFRPGLGCGLGLAFAAGALMLAARAALPRRGAPKSSPAWSDDAAAAGLKDLWSEDDGRDGDEN